MLNLGDCESKIISSLNYKTNATWCVSPLNKNGSIEKKSVLQILWWNARNLIIKTFNDEKTQCNRFVLVYISWWYFSQRILIVTELLKMTTVIFLTMGGYLINLQSCWLIYALLWRAIARIRFNKTSWTYSYIMHRRYRSTLISVMASLASWLSSAHFLSETTLAIENHSQLFQVHMNMMFIFSLPYTTKEAFAWGKQYCRYTLQYWTMAMKHVMKEKPYAWMLMLCGDTLQIVQARWYIP